MNTQEFRLHRVNPLKNRRVHIVTSRQARYEGTLVSSTPVGFWVVDLLVLTKTGLYKAVSGKRHTCRKFNYASVVDIYPVPNIL